ncbi:pimeloyl-ACP methyl ester carboxylesterase [Desulfobotulus alkaliphilus]|uniref:Pimeloyl-ACP methyl ester carboxylesterase n=1 Tax=Desulfobotulus alkaliphilus TaxID=622671 RepID=A0A562RIJ2_9BACT|nr:alpha/beta hydrolase [Desulfobotulus alkaliphilus]TWI68897.1 pimeloyl-ACP methyl ester carboxylesterase [Desulfobotulus alkaliphilus]
MKTAGIILGILLILAAIPFGMVQFFPEKSLDFALDAERRKSGLIRKEIHFGRDLHYVYLEGGQGAPLMLLHGFGADKDNFTRIARFLTPHYRVIIPDHTGFGESARPEGASYTPEEQAERLHRLAEGLGITSMHMGGSSMGGQIAMVYASMYPDQVESLWLLNPGGLWDGPTADAWKTMTADTDSQNPLIIEKEEDIFSLPSLVMEKAPYTPKAFLRVIARERMKNARLEKKIFKDILSSNVREKIEELNTPALIVWGREDRVLHPGNAEILHGLLPLSSLILMEGIGHLPMLEAPEQSAEDYLNFRKNL